MKNVITLILKNKYILFLLIVTFFAIKPLLHPGLPPTHDGEYHIIRFYEFDKALRDGSVYPRWAADLNNGYGVPLFNYVYPLPNYFGSLFHALGLSFIDAFKMSLLAATYVSVIFFYLWLRLFFNNSASFTGAIFYAFAPYRFVDVYVRGSVGEVWALAFFPAFLWAITKLIRERKILYIVLASLFLAGTIFSHNILALMFMLFGVVYAAFMILLTKWNKEKVYDVGYVFVLGLCLSAVFWLPALLEKEYVQGLQIYDVGANFPELYQLLIPSWGTGFSGGSLENQMSFQIGVANLLAVFAGFILLIKSIKKKKENAKLFIFFLSWFFLVFFLMLSASKSLWDTIPFLHYFQFPWRFLSLMIVICSFIAGATIALIQGKKLRLLIGVFFIIVAVVSTLSYTEPAYYHNRTDSHYLTRSNFINGTNSPGNLFNTIWMNKMPAVKNKKIEVVKGQARISIQEVKTTKLSFAVESKNSSRIVANIAYFPGWKVLVDGKDIFFDKTQQGAITFVISEGNHMVEMRFNDTMIRKIAGGISILAFVVCIGILLWKKRRRN